MIQYAISSSRTAVTAELVRTEEQVEVRGVSRLLVVHDLQPLVLDDPLEQPQQSASVAELVC